MNSAKINKSGGLVPTGSVRNANTCEPIGERASSMLWSPVRAGPYAATKPKARSPMGFFLGAKKLVSGGECALVLHSKVNTGRAEDNLGCESRLANQRCRKLTNADELCWNSPPATTTNQFHTPQSGLSLESLFMRLLLGRGRFIAVR